MRVLTAMTHLAAALLALLTPRPGRHAMPAPEADAARHLALITPETPAPDAAPPQPAPGAGPTGVATLTRIARQQRETCWCGAPAEVLTWPNGRDMPPLPVCAQHYLASGRAAEAEPSPLLIRPYYVAHERRQQRQEGAHAARGQAPPPVAVLERTLAGLHALPDREVAA